MIDEIRRWRHLFKLDPDKPLAEEALEALCLSGTDAILVGGSSGITFDNTVELLSRIRRFEVACMLEVSTPDAIVPGFDGYLIPVVLNASDTLWTTRLHHQALREYGAWLDESRVAAEGYVIMNPQSTAALVTEAIPLADEKDMVAYARMADMLFRLPIFYVEYSGRFGDMEWLRSASRTLRNARLVYGGGIDGPDKAKMAVEAGADTIVVGNLIYEDLTRALETVAVVRS